MKRFLVLTLAFAVTGLFVAASPAHAGGWAITSLDSVVTPVVGEPIDVGFTILQHGVTPVDLDEGVGIEITGPSGKTEFFPAQREGPTGHYLATVTFREAGTTSWSVAQGWFAPQPLGQITVGSAAAAPAGSASSPSPALLRYGLPALALLLGAYAAFDAFHSRRRRRMVVA